MITFFPAFVKKYSYFYPGLTSAFGITVHRFIDF